VFNPFETNENQSPRFLALQAKRALEAILGKSPYTEESIASERDNPLVELMVNREDYRRGFPIAYSKGKHPEIRIRTWLVGAIVFVCIWLMLGILGILKYRTSKLQRFFSILFTTIISVTIGIAIFQIFLEITRLLAETRPLNFIPVLLRYLAESIPLSNGVLLLILIATILSAYKIIESQFEKLEPPLGKIKQIWKEYG
jgi:hypothetical protein